MCPNCTSLVSPALCVSLVGRDRVCGGSVCACGFEVDALQGARRLSGSRRRCMAGRGRGRLRVCSGQYRLAIVARLVERHGRGEQASRPRRCECRRAEKLSGALSASALVDLLLSASPRLPCRRLSTSRSPRVSLPSLPALATPTAVQFHPQTRTAAPSSLQLCPLPHSLTALASPGSCTDRRARPARRRARGQRQRHPLVQQVGRQRGRGQGHLAHRLHPSPQRRPPPPHRRSLCHQAVPQGSDAHRRAPRQQVSHLDSRFRQGVGTSNGVLASGREWGRCSTRMDVRKRQHRRRTGAGNGRDDGPGPGEQGHRS